MTDITLNPIALLKTVVVITAAVSIGYLISHKGAAGTAERRAAVVEQSAANQDVRQPKPPVRQVDSEGPKLWSEERTNEIEQAWADSRASWQTRTWGEILDAQGPKPEPPEQPERRVMTFETMGAERQRAAAQEAREQRENTGTEQPSD
ncbi:hypothetical protein [Nitrincola alkalisediminis]|uniref:hypothetical protein n=1 Tax=Nitrincola alkalisediminis TaxID=1366656 RepID=UPI001873CADB|nr:hypothetical protein [Nitrincola alkalisediminis]